MKSFAAAVKLTMRAHMIHGSRYRFQCKALACTVLPHRHLENPEKHGDWTILMRIALSGFCKSLEQRPHYHKGPTRRWKEVSVVLI